MVYCLLAVFRTTRKGCTLKIMSKRISKQARSYLLNGAVIGRDCIIGAGAVVPQGAVIPDGSLVLGMPGKVRRAVTEEEKAANADSARRYVAKARDYMACFAEK